MSIPLAAVPHWLQWILVAGVALAVVAGAIRSIPPLWKFLQKAIGLVNALAELPEFLEKNDPILDELAKQVVNDHGHVNLRSQLDRIEDAQKRLETGVAGLYDDQQELTKRVDSAEDTWRKRPNDNHDS